jgi:hypothetical protein
LGICQNLLQLVCEFIHSHCLVLFPRKQEILFDGKEMVAETPFFKGLFPKGFFLKLFSGFLWQDQNDSSWSAMVGPVATARLRERQGYASRNVEAPVSR